jgi:hypothetical protein
VAGSATGLPAAVRQPDGPQRTAVSAIPALTCPATGRCAPILAEQH